MPRPSQPPQVAPPADRRIPRVALALGVVSLAPFLAATAAIVLGDHPAIALYGRVALISYGTCVLSFLGAVHAGLAIRETPLPAARLIVAAVAPAVAGLSLALGERNGLLLQGAGLLGLLAYDIAAGRRGWVPAWYPRLRWPLTGVALVCVLVAMRFAPL